MIIVLMNDMISTLIHILDLTLEILCSLIRIDQLWELLLILTIDILLLEQRMDQFITHELNKLLELFIDKQIDLINSGGDDSLAMWKNELGNDGLIDHFLLFLRRLVDFLESLLINVVGEESGKSGNVFDQFKEIYIGLFLVLGAIKRKRKVFEAQIEELVAEYSHLIVVASVLKVHRIDIIELLIQLRFQVESDIESDIVNVYCFEIHYMLYVYHILLERIEALEFINIQMR